MKNENARIIDDLTIKQIKYAAFKLRQFPAFRGVEVCDIEQDLAVELIESMQKFNSDLSKKSYFVDQVLNSRSKNLLLKKIREHNEKYSSFNEKYDVADPRVNVDCSLDKIDMETIIQRLPDDLRDLCNLIMNGWNTSETAELLGISRSKIYDNLNSLKPIFERFKKGAMTENGN